MMGDIKELVPYIVLFGFIGMAIYGFKGNNGGNSNKGGSSKGGNGSSGE